MLLNHATNLGKPTAGFRIYLNRNQQVQAITDTLITAGSWMIHLKATSESAKHIWKQMGPAPHAQEHVVMV